MTLTLYQFAPAFGLPNASPFCMKVETYLRMAGVPFRTAVGTPIKAPKGKLPYIDDAGRIVADSGFIIDHLKQAYGDTLDAGLDRADRARAHAIRRLLEESLYWPLLYSRFVDEAGWSHTREAFFAPLPVPLRWVVPVAVRRLIAKQLQGQGMGRHSRDEIYASGAADIEALAILLGDKPYFLGDRPTSVDASAYAFLANVLGAPADSALKSAARKQANLLKYCETMRARFFP